MNDLPLKLVLKVLTRSGAQSEQGRTLNKIFAMSGLNKRTRARHALGGLLEKCAVELRKGELEEAAVTGELEALRGAEEEDHLRRAAMFAKLHSGTSEQERKNAVERGRYAAARRAQFPPFSLLPDAGVKAGGEGRMKERKTLVERLVQKLGLEEKELRSLLQLISVDRRDPEERWAEAEAQAKAFYEVFEKKKTGPGDFAKALKNNGGEIKKARVIVEQLEKASKSLTQTQRAMLADLLEKRAEKLKERRRRNPAQDHR